MKNFSFTVALLALLGAAAAGEAVFDHTANEATCERCVSFVQLARKNNFRIGSPQDLACPLMQLPSSSNVDGTEKDLLCSSVWEPVKKLGHGSVFRSDLAAGDDSHALCARDVCVRSSLCQRTRCESCQEALGPAVFSFKNQISFAEDWARDTLPHLCASLPSFSEKHSSMCGPLGISQVQSEIRSWNEGSVPKNAALRICQASKECSETSSQYFHCEVVTKRQQENIQKKVLNYGDSCEYRYTFSSSAKVSIGAMTSSSSKATPEDSTIVRNEAVSSFQAEITITKIGEAGTGSQNIFRMDFTSAVGGMRNQQGGGGSSSSSSSESSPTKSSTSMGDLIDLTPILSRSPVYFVQAPNGAILQIATETATNSTSSDKDEEEEENQAYYNMIRSQIVDMLHFQLRHFSGSYAVEESPSSMYVHYSVEKKDTDIIQIVRNASNSQDFKSKASHGDEGIARTSTKTMQIDPVAGIILSVQSKEQHLGGGRLTLPQRAIKQATDEKNLDAFVLRAFEASSLRLISGGDKASCSTKKQIFLPDSSSPFFLRNLGQAVGAALVQVPKASATAEFAQPSGAILLADTTVVTASSSALARRIPKLVSIMLLAEKKKSNGDEAAELLEAQLTQILRGDKKSAGNLIPFLNQRKNSSPAVFSTICRALANVADGNKLAQQVLLRHVLVNKRGFASESDIEVVLSSFISASRIIKPLVDWIEKEATSWPQTPRRAIAASVLSSFASRFSETSTFCEHVRGIARGILAGAAVLSADNDARRSEEELALVMMGNIGSRLDLDMIKPFLVSEDRLLREQALISLRRIPGHDVTDLVADHFISSEVNQMARLTALSTLTERPTSGEFWVQFLAELKKQQQKDSAASLTRVVVEKLSEILRSHGINNAELTFSRDDQEFFALEDLDEDDASSAKKDDDDEDEDDDTDIDVLKLIQTDSPSRSVISARKSSNLLWGEDTCSKIVGSRPRTSFDESRSIGFGAKSLRAGVDGTIIGKSYSSSNKGWCASFAGDAAFKTRVIGRRFDIFSLRIESQSRGRDELTDLSSVRVRPVLSVFGYQLALLPSKPTIPTSAHSIVCGDITPVSVFPANASSQKTAIFAFTLESRWKSVEFRIGTSLILSAGVVLEQCHASKSSEHIFAAGATPHAKITTFAECRSVYGQDDVAAAGLVTDVFSGDFVMTGNMNVDASKAACDGEATDAMALHLNGDSHNTRLYSYVRNATFVTESAAVCFPHINCLEASPSVSTVKTLHQSCGCGGAGSSCKPTVSPSSSVKKTTISGRFPSRIFVIPPSLLALQKAPSFAAVESSDKKSKVQTAQFNAIRDRIREVATRKKLIHIDEDTIATAQHDMEIAHIARKKLIRLLGHSNLQSPHVRHALKAVKRLASKASEYVLLQEDDEEDDDDDDDEDEESDEDLDVDPEEEEQQEQQEQQQQAPEQQEQQQQAPEQQEGQEQQQELDPNSAAAVVAREQQERLHEIEAQQLEAEQAARQRLLEERREAEIAEERQRRMEELERSADLPPGWAKREKKRVLTQFADRAAALYSAASKMYKKNKKMDEAIAEVMQKAHKTWAKAFKYFTKFNKYRTAAEDVLRNVRAGVHEFGVYNDRAKQWAEYADGTVKTINDAKARVHNLRKASEAMLERFHQAEGKTTEWGEDVQRYRSETRNAVNKVMGLKRAKEAIAEARAKWGNK